MTFDFFADSGVDGHTARVASGPRHVSEASAGTFSPGRAGDAQAGEKGPTLKRHLVIGPATLHEVHAALEQFWSDNPRIPDDVHTSVSLAAAEIAANIVQHSRAVDCEVEVQLLSNAVLVEFTDRGDPADVDLLAVRLPEEMAEHGRGLAIAQATLAVLTYNRDELGNHWRLMSDTFSLD